MGLCGTPFGIIRFSHHSFTSTSFYACYFRWSENREQQNLTGQSERKVVSPLSAVPTHQVGSPAFASLVFHAAFYPDKRIQYIVEQSLSSPATPTHLEIQ